MYGKTKYSLKKTIALTCLLLANTVLLAHAVVSHHHHDEILVTCAAAHCEHDCNSHDQHHSDEAQPVGECNDPYCHGSEEDCSLSKIYVRFSNDRQVSQLFDSECKPLPSLFVPFMVFPIPQIENTIGLPFRQKPYLISNYTNFISRSFGLRAPPYFN